MYYDYFIKIYSLHFENVSYTFITYLNVLSYLVVIGLNSKQNPNSNKKKAIDLNQTSAPLFIIRTEEDKIRAA